LGEQRFKIRDTEYFRIEDENHEDEQGKENKRVPESAEEI